MRIEENLIDETKEGGEITVFLEEADDVRGAASGPSRLLCNVCSQVWTVFQLVEKDDEIRANTTRKVARKDNPRAGSEKRHVTLTLRAVSADYDGDADVVRVAGINIAESEACKLGAAPRRRASDVSSCAAWRGWIFRGGGSRHRRGCHVDSPRRHVSTPKIAGAHHTLELGIRSRVTLRKKVWDAAQRAAVARAADAAATADLACLLVDLPSESRRPVALLGPSSFKGTTPHVLPQNDRRWSLSLRGGSEIDARFCY